MECALHCDGLTRRRRKKRLEDQVRAAGLIAGPGRVGFDRDVVFKR